MSQNRLKEIIEWYLGKKSKQLGMEDNDIGTIFINGVDTVDFEDIAIEISSCPEVKEMLK